MTSTNDSRGSYGQIAQNDNDMSTSLVAPSPEEVSRPASAVPMIEIVAPATLMEGYQLQTQIGDRVVTVTIPPGGVEKGQKFSIPMTPEQQQYQNNDSNNNAAAVRKLNIPVGHWKDGMCDCFQYGPCHASVCVSLWCCSLAAGQVISRLQLKWTGEPTNSASDKATAFSILFFITMMYLALKVLFFFIIMGYMPENPNESPPDEATPFMVMNDILFYAYWILSALIIRNLRSYIRKKYAIPENESCPTGCEDGCTSCFCPCLTAAQMMRHTTEYETYRAECFSETGLPAHVPALIV